MKEETGKILHGKSLFDARERQLNTLTEYYKNRPQHPLCLHGISIFRAITPKQLTGELIDSLFDELASRAAESADEAILRPLAIEVQLYGVHFIDKLCGAQIHYNDEQNLWWSEGLTTPIGALSFPDLEQSTLWQACTRLYGELLARDIRLPFLATQILGSPTVGIFNLYKENILYGFYDNPGGVKRDLRVLTDLLLLLHKWFLEKIPQEQFQPVCVDGRLQPRGCGQMCGCTTQLISNELYEEFIFPLDKEIFALYENGGLYHLCGAHTQHIKTWRSWDDLKAVQLNDRAADDFEAYFTGLRDDQLIYLNPSEAMPIEKALSISGGRRTIIVSDKDSLQKATGCGCGCCGGHKA